MPTDHLCAAADRALPWKENIVMEYPSTGSGHKGRHLARRWRGRGIAQRLLSALLPLTLCACQSMRGHPQFPFYTKQQQDKLVEAFDKVKIDGCIEKPTEKELQTCRDEIVNSQLATIDFAYDAFKASIAQAAGGIDVAGDLLAAAVSGASTIATAVRAKTIFSAIATVITGGKSSIDKDVFFQQSVHVIVGRMDALRVKALQPIRLGTTQPAAKYPLVQALRDVEGYLEAGSVGAAVTDIESNSGATKKAAEEATQDVVTDTFDADPNTDLLHKFWKPDGKTTDTAHAALLQTEMAAAHVPEGTSVPFFLNARGFAAERAKVVAALKLK